MVLTWRSVPSRSSKAASSSCPSHLATAAGVMFVSLILSVSAPDTTSSLAAWNWPLQQARCKGVALLALPSSTRTPGC
jgi:hypothetical protein